MTTESLPVEFTGDERRVLTECEQKIRAGLRTFLEVGQALAMIRDQRLYRESHETFESYCRDRWSITDRRARQLIDATEVVAALPTGTTVPVTESQARELVGLDGDQAAQVMETASSAGKVTASSIRETRAATFLPSGKPDSRSVTDISRAVPEVRKPPRRRSLPDQYWTALFDLDKAVRRLEKLHADDRFDRHRKDLHDRHWRLLSEIESVVADAGTDLNGTLTCDACEDRMVPSRSFAPKCEGCR